MVLRALRRRNVGGEDFLVGLVEMAVVGVVLHGNDPLP
jgi:hypothetical protein